MIYTQLYTRFQRHLYLLKMIDLTWVDSNVKSRPKSASIFGHPKILNRHWKVGEIWVRIEQQSLWEFWGLT